VTADALLLLGVASAVVSVVVLFIEGAIRPGYDPGYHTGSELQLGDRGWVQIANFLQMGAREPPPSHSAYIRSLGMAIGAALLGVFAFGMIVAGFLLPDAARGYPPPGFATEGQARFSWHHRVHHVIGGPVAFIAIFAACLTLATKLDGAWVAYTVLTAAAGAAMTVWTAASYQQDARDTGVVQRGLILVYWTWIVVLGIHLVTYPA
jgi:Protein of unknown function (DUF998)